MFFTKMWTWSSLTAAFVLAATGAAGAGRAEKPETAPAPRAKLEPKTLATDKEIDELMRAGEFPAAEKALRRRLPECTGVDAAFDRLLLGVCVVERARSAESPKEALWREASELFQKAADGAKNALPDNGRAAWVRTQAELRVLQVLHQSRESDKLLAAAPAILERHRGTVGELIVLSLTYHAHMQKDDAKQALEVYNEMATVFAGLAKKDEAFTARQGEFSRDYWEKVWFTPEK